MRTCAHMYLDMCLYMYMHVCLGIWRYMHICMCMVFNVYADLHIDKGTCIEFAHVYAYVHASTCVSGIGQWHEMSWLQPPAWLRGWATPHLTRNGRQLVFIVGELRRRAAFSLRGASPSLSEEDTFSLRGGHQVAAG